MNADAPTILSTFCWCPTPAPSRLHTYHAPPDGETRFDRDGAYRRELHRCAACGHVRSAGHRPDDDLYAGDYVHATYGTLADVRAAFDRIMALPPERSDNRRRVARIRAVVSRCGPPGPLRLLDVGSGLGVFPVAMRDAGWRCIALDPDPIACAHLRARGLDVIEDRFGPDTRGAGDCDVITFNKVLEHVDDPLAMLRAAATCVRPGGIVYVEVPDVAAADDEARFGREEFFIEHLHVFSPASLDALARAAGFDVLDADALREPSGKYTCFVFLRPEAPA